MPSEDFSFGIEGCNLQNFEQPLLKGTIMDTLKFISIALLAVLAAAAQADEADGSDRALDFQGQRTRAEVRAEAARVSATRSQIPLAARPHGVVNSNKARATVLDEAARAARLGLIPHGETGG